jgi:tripartite ATP-independent transporter DctP family solute receptor
MRIIRSFAGAALAAVMVASAWSSQAEPVKLVMAGAPSADNATSRAMEMFKAEVESRTHNAVTIELAPQMKLGGAVEIVQKVRAGTIFASWVPASYISRLIPELDVVNLPFMFDSYDAVQGLVRGPTGKLIEARLDAKGFTTLLWMEYGGRSVMNAKRPLKTLDDFKDLKLRLTTLELLHATFRALGTTTVTTDTNDVYAGLQRGDFDGMETPYSVSNNFGFADNQKYISDTNHIQDPVLLIANKAAFKDLPPEQQKAMRDAARAVAPRERKLVHDTEAAALASLQARGLQFDPLPPETRKGVRKVAASVIDRMKRRIDAELVDKVMAEVGREHATR